MKQIYRLPIFIFSAILSLSYLVCSCVNDEIVSEQNDKHSSDKINFNISVNNVTRADSKLQDTHYEFGVFAYQKNGTTPESLMNNYLVAWCDESSPYKDWWNRISTYGDPESAVHGSSYWFYEQLGSAEGKHVDEEAVPSTSEQILKFWDKSKTSVDFYAYTPYYTTDAEFDQTNEKLSLTGVSSFFVNPTTDGQVTTAKTKTDATPEYLIDHNEVMYANKKTVERSNFGNDVDLNFKHLNAKIRLAFYTSITSYKVTLTDLVPEQITGSPFTIEKQEGVVLTPAIVGNTSATITQPGTNTEFDTKGDVVIDYNTTPAATWSNYTTSNENLCFQVKDYPSLPTSNASLVALPTIYYAVPQSGSTCGFTVHVSFKMESAPNITGTSDVIQLYDARVWVPASACKWEAGKAYTYIFNINDNCSGTTDPQRKDPNKADEPYIDPSDPRVIATGELHPIQFETVLVDQYDEIYNGIYPVGGATVTEKVGDGNMYAYTTMPYANIPSNVEGYTFLENPRSVFDRDVTYNPTTHNFTVSNGTVSINFPAQTFTEYDVSGKNNYAYFYLFTSNSKSAVKFTAKEEDSWAVTPTELATYNGQAYSIYIKNLHENISISANADSKISDTEHHTEYVEHVISEATGTLSLVQVNNTAISGTEHTIDNITCTISGKTVTISGTPTKVGDYTFRIKDSGTEGTGQYVNVYVYVNDVVGFNSYTEISSGAYQYTNNATYQLHDVDGYNATTDFYNDATKWSYDYDTETSKYKFTYSDTDASITMSFAETGSNEVYFWTESGKVKKLSNNSGSCTWSDIITTYTGKAYTIYKKKP